MAKRESEPNDQRRQPIQRATLFLEVYGPADYPDRETGEIKTARAYFRVSGVIGDKDDDQRVALPDIKAQEPTQIAHQANTLLEQALANLDRALTTHLRAKAAGR